jgi:hypothetical protein
MEFAYSTFPSQVLLPDCGWQKEQVPAKAIVRRSGFEERTLIGSPVCDTVAE